MAGMAGDKRFIACAKCGTVLVEYRPQESIQRRAMRHLRQCVERRDPAIEQTMVKGD